MRQRVVVAMAVGALMGLISARSVRAQETVERVTLEEALSLFAQHNLELRIARADAREAIDLARQSAAYPNPTLSVTHETLGGAAEYSETYLNLSQTVDWPWLAAARRTAASRVRDALGARVVADSARLAFEVKRTFIEAAAAERRRDALDEATALVRHAEGQATARAADGDLSEYALRRLRVERARYETDLLAATLALRVSRRALASLVLADSVPDLAPVGLPDGEPVGLALGEVLDAAGVRRSEWLAAASWTAAARAGRRAAGARRLPVPTLTAAYKDQSDGLTGAFLGIALPLPLFDRNGAAVAAGDAAVRGAEAREQLVARQIHNDVRRAHDAYVAARQRANLVRTDLVDDTDALLRIARVAHEEGEMTLVELFDAVEAFRVAHAVATEAIADLWVGYYDLERAVGGPLAALSTEEVR